MDSLIHRGMNQIATELKKFDTNIKNLTYDDKNKDFVEKSLKTIERTVAETKAANNNEIIEDFLKKISNNLSIINKKLKSSGNLYDLTFANLKKGYP